MYKKRQKNLSLFADYPDPLLNIIEKSITVFFPISTTFISIRLMFYLISIDRPELFVESISSVHGLGVLLLISLFLPLILTPYFFLPSLACGMLSNNTFVDKVYSNKIFLIIFPVLATSIFTLIYRDDIVEWLSNIIKTGIAGLLIWLLINMIQLRLSNKTQGHNEIKAVKHILKGCWQQRFLTIQPIYLNNFILLCNYNWNVIISHHKQEWEDLKLLNEDCKVPFFPEISSWFHLVMLFGLILFSGILIIFPFFFLQMVLIQNLDVAQFKSYLIVGLIVGCIPGLMFIYANSDKEKNASGKSPQLRRMFFFLFLFTLAMFTILPTKISSASLRLTGIFSEEEHTFLLLTSEKANGLTEAQITLQDNNTFKAYRRYAFGNIRWLCKDLFVPDQSAHTKAEGKPKNGTPKKGCVELDKSDIMQLSSDLENP